MKDNLRYTILYVRISKDDDAAGDSNSITTQLAILQKYANDHAYQNIKVIKDDGYSGTNFNRPGFQEMYSLVKSRQVERILVKDLSRLGRNYIETGRFIDLEFPRYNTQFIAVNENFDSNGGDRFLVAVWNLLNELYAMDISNKQKQSIRAKSDSGRHITSKIPFGYKLDPEDKHKWIIDEPAAETVRVIFRLFNAGKGTTEICRYLTEHKFISPSNHNKQAIKGSRAVADPYYWCVSSVINILDRQEYVGDTVNFKTYHTSFKDKKVRKNSREDYVIIHDTQEPIISREEFEKARKRRNANKRISTEKQFHLLDGMVFCGDCKNRMYLNRKKRKSTVTYIYLCNRYKKEKLCSAHYIREDYLIKTVLDQIAFLQEKFSEGKIEFRRFIYSAINHRTSEHIRQVNSRINAIQERLNQIRTTETKMYEDKLTGKVDEETFHNITHVLNNEARNLTDENSQLLVILDKVEDLKMGIDNFVQKIERFANCTVTENDRVIMEQLIDHIEIYENDSREISVRIFFADIGVIE